MPPEQFTDAASCDERSDIYSFGVVLFQMASGGSLPFLAPRPSDGSEAEKARFWREMYRLHSNAPMPRINSPLFPTIERCMEKDPARRFQSFSELRGKLELALKTLCEEVNVAPTPRALGAKEWNAKGVSLDNLGRHDEALSCYERALDADPQFALAWNNKGAALDALDRREEALRCYEKALDVDPELALAWGNKGASLANLGRYLDAVRCYDRALELDPLAAAAWSGKRSGLLRLGRYDEASRCNNRKLESANRIAQDWALEGTRLWTDGHLEQAVDCLSRAVEISPPAAGAWSVMGLCLMSLRRYEEVVRCYDRLLEIDPWTREPTDEGSGQFADSWAQSKDYVLGNRGRCLYHLGRHAEAMRDFREALRLNPRLAPAWSYSGLCLSKLGRHDEAIRCHDNAQKSDPQFALAWFNKGLSLELQGQKNDAILAYRQFIAMARDASSAEVQEAHTRLRGLE